MSSPRAVPAAFAARDWLLLAAAALMWGGSFLLIKIGVADLAPATVAWLRLLFGAAALALLPASRAPLRHRREWRPVAVLGLVWMAVPFVLFPVAQQTVPSSLAGMINGAAPLFTALIAVAWYRKSPGRRVVIGLVVGFAGVVFINVPAAGGGATLGGIALLLAATVMYGVAFNLAEPLENRNGGLAVIWRAELVAAAVLTPAGLHGLLNSTPTVSSMTAMLALGALSTGVAFALFAVLIGRVGAPRASVTVYLVPVVAIALGAGLSGEPVAAASLVGTALVLLGAYLASGTRSRIRRRGSRRPPEPAAAPATGG